ncbi:alpha/beta hydrolase [Aestuariirhabdus litorea]|uniref:Alpha/beta hydrolase n=1 Tax=Aestuariirhabdus litorea TaxID=2528527 RepID=A0A3P3VKJ7_9GAMM|nr:alpha/beta hydrolase [Aestuariirhabdus litorea]RRJ83220.1 alpha/beta hydrolase [Aestuariirhabdus litorea]RWW93377.1 steryl acetyl hydrolase [Endozoicomonadaceae bacterium GTF-13]
MALLDLLRLLFTSLLGMLLRPQRPAERSWRSEWLCRLSRQLLHESIDKPVDWLRTRQDLLRHYHPALRQVRIEADTIAGVPCQWCIPRGLDEGSPLVLYFHGGGFVIGNVRGYRPMIAALAVAGECTVLGVDYRLAPEHPLPAAQEDCLAVCRAMRQRYPDRPLLLAGDSAGGSLCLSTLVALRQQGLRASGALLISPLCEVGATDPSMTDNAATDMLSLSLARHWGQLAQGGTPRPELLKPLNFTAAELGGLPPLCVQASGREILLDPIERFVAHARSQGVEVDYQCWPGQFHVFQIFAPLMPEAAVAIARLGDAIKTMTREKR